jgi:rifampicin phosphotransferase
MEYIYGQTASMGKYIGSAKIVNSLDDLAKVGKGDIIIAPETVPDMLVKMKDAGGIITDIGGFNSHGATVCREYGIPCIIGAKTQEGNLATEILKDNYLLDMDAMNLRKGIVMYDSRKN